MYIDTSRLRDLEQLKKKLDDPRIPVGQKKKYFVAHKKIMSQLHDKKLAAMRERLRKAYWAEDKYETWKITNQIKDYLGEETLEEGTM